MNDCRISATEWKGVLKKHTHTHRGKKATPAVHTNAQIFLMFRKKVRRGERVLYKGEPKAKE